MNFHDLGLNKAILGRLGEIGLTTPTPIQLQAIPPILEGKDVVGLAQTGTGKTAAFLLPLLQRQAGDGRRGKFRPVRVLVLSPTRELAAQIFEKARDYGSPLNLRCQCIVGGIPINRQQRGLTRGADMVIATPGRLLDLVKREAVSLDRVQSVVLDEADHMLDIGFLPDIRRIFSHLPAVRQTLLFSATMPTPIRELAENYLQSPEQISVARDSSVADNIDQLVRHVSSRKKHDELVSVLNIHKEKRVVVFARTKHGSDKIVQRLQALEINAAAIHGNKSQGQRERALDAFAKGDCKVLVATDIAARGIDIKGVGLVVNYELPSVPEVYVHRIGRTARAGASGLAVAFCAPDEIKSLRSIEKLIGITIPSEGECVEPPGDTGKAKQAKAKQGKRVRKRTGPYAAARGNDAAKKRKRKHVSARAKVSSQRDQTGQGDQTGVSRARSRKSKPAG